MTRNLELKTGTVELKENDIYVLPAMFTKVFESDEEQIFIHNTTKNASFKLKYLIHQMSDSDISHQKRIIQTDTYGIIKEGIESNLQEEFIHKSDLLGKIKSFNLKLHPDTRLRYHEWYEEDGLYRSAALDLQIMYFEKNTTFNQQVNIRFSYDDSMPF